VPSQILPKCGIVVEDTDAGADGLSLAMGWLYLDNSVGVAMLAWMVTNPHNTSRGSARAIAILAEGARQVAAELGYQVMLVTATETISRLLRGHGFVRASEVPHFHLMKVTPATTTGGIR
jgi:hypothetical protein